MKHSIDLLPAKRVVIKIGSALLVNSQGKVNQSWLHSLCADVHALVQKGVKVVLVSSGTIALGRRVLKLIRQQLHLEEKQAAAAVGQIHLAHAYQENLQQFELMVAQVLMTLEDTENRQRYLSVSHTLERLLHLNVIPVINENDTVTTAETKYGDNDRLAARVAQMVMADTLILLSDIDGLYTADPGQDPKAQFIPIVRELSADILAMGGESGSNVGSGGMRTKLAAAKMVMSAGCKMVICRGHVQNPIQALMAPETRCTWFLPPETPQTARKNWLAQHLKPKGAVVIDAGAQAALLQGKSLLAAGIVSVQGRFAKGDPIQVLGPTQQELGRGLTNYADHEIEKIKGCPSQKIEATLGYLGSTEVIHRDDLVLV